MTCHLEGPLREIKAGCRQRAQKDLGHVPFGVCLGPAVKSRLLSSNQRELSSLSFVWGLRGAQVLGAGGGSHKGH